jgi:hypothetical protein
MTAYQRFDPRTVTFDDLDEGTLDPAKVAKVAKVVRGPWLPSLYAPRTKPERDTVRVKPTADRRSVQDWSLFFDQRAFVAEYERGLPRCNAEAIALECCVVEWLNQNFAASSPDRCLECSRGGTDSDPLLPHGADGVGHVWLHLNCWPGWQAKRREEAIAALASMDITAISDSGS